MWPQPMLPLTIIYFKFKHVHLKMNEEFYIDKGTIP